MATVTAIIPVYNRAHLVGASIRSALEQTRPVNEIIVVDDGSTDDTVKVVESFGPAVTCIRQHNGGAGAARNRGLSAATCDRIAFLDSDDLWTTDKNARQMEFMDRHPQIGLSFGDMAIFSEKDPDNWAPEIKIREVHDYFRSDASQLDRILECLVQQNMISTSCVMIRRDCVARVGQFDPTLRIAEDLDYWLRAGLVCKFGFVDAVLNRRRRHGSNLINDWVGMNIFHLQVLERFLERGGNVPEAARRAAIEKISSLRYDLGSACLKKARFAEAHAFLRADPPGAMQNPRWFVKRLLANGLKGLG